MLRYSLRGIKDFEEKARPKSLYLGDLFFQSSFPNKIKTIGPLLEMRVRISLQGIKHFQGFKKPVYVGVLETP